MVEPYFLYRDGLIREEVLMYDQYYCKPEIAKELIAVLDMSQYDHIIEPCAGNGSFSLQIPNCEAYDIDPQHPSIKQANFFDLSFDYDPEKTLIIGGPPFGKDAEYATLFVARAMRFANTIAFILPIDFTFDLHLIHEEEMDPNSFTAGGYNFSYPCSFQIFKTKV